MTLCSLPTLTNMFISVDILDKFWPVTHLEFAAIGYYGMALHKTVPENRNTVTRLDIGSITSRCSGKCARTHPPKERLDACDFLC